MVQCRGVLVIWIIVGQRHTALVVGAGGGVWPFFLSTIISHFAPSLWEATRYRLKNCLKGSIKSKQPPNHTFVSPSAFS